MPLSKKRNRDRMKRIRLHALLSSPRNIKPVQPKPIDRLIGKGNAIAPWGGLGEKYPIDADGNPIYEE